MSLSSWLRNGTGDEERRLLQLQDAEDVDHLYAQWREDREADMAPVIPITAGAMKRCPWPECPHGEDCVHAVEQASGLSGAGRPPGAPGHTSAPSTSAESSHHFNKNAAPASCPSPDAA